VREGLDLRVHDSVALDEIELYAEVLSAVAASDRPLTSEELDEVLGVRSVALLGAAMPSWRSMLGGRWPPSPRATILPGGRAPGPPRPRYRS
jgi:hypothetical protein